MHVLIIGAAGMLGGKLAARLRADGRLRGAPIERLTLADIVAPQAPAGGIETIEAVTLDLASEGAATRIVADRPDVVFHLAAIVSGQAEADFDLGTRVNLDGTRNLFDAIRMAHDTDGYHPRVVFASSIAVFGAPFPDHPIPDGYHLTPLTSYGTQKAIGELLLADYTRRSFMDGIGLRLPTITIRPGKPNKAASGFFSSILREPIHGREAVLPVPDEVRHWFASPRSAIGFLVHAAELDGEAVGPHRNLDMPGLSATVGEEVEALRRMVGQGAVDLIQHEPDEAIMRIVGNWAPSFAATRARDLGFTAETSFDEIIRVYLEDEMDVPTA